MSGRFFLSGTTPLYEGEPQPLSTFTFSLAGTSTAQDAYTDAANLVATSNPYTLDANGYAGEIFLSRARYRVVWKSAAGTTLKSWDPVDKDQVFTRGAGLPSDPHPGQKHANTSDGHTYEYKLATSAWLDLGASDAVGNTATVTEQLTGTSASVYATPDSVAGLWQRGPDIASASTLSLPAAGGGVFNITGTTGITGIGSAQGGRTVKLKFAGALTLTHNATSFILPGAANITTVAGDTAEFINEAAADGSGSNWRCVDYQTSDNRILLGAVKADQETATSTSIPVVPGVQQYHPSAAKAWLYSAVSAGAPATPPTAHYNITSMADTGTGVTTVTIATDFSSADWCALGTNQAASATGGHATNTSKAAGTIILRNYAGNDPAVSDPDGYNFAGFGDQ